MTLFAGLALVAAAVDKVAETFWICKECLGYLKPSKVPPFAQCSGGWVGEVPDVLRDLTLSECLLIARSFMHAYLIKMRPKTSATDPSLLMDGLVGNVSAVEMPQPDIECMLQGSFGLHMPLPLAVLSECISVVLPSDTQ